MECAYHTIIDRLLGRILLELYNNHNGYFEFWINDHPLRSLYKETFEEVIGHPLTPGQLTIVESKEYNLEKTIYKWYMKWKTQNPMPRTAEADMPFRCIDVKVREYIFYQFKKQDIIQIIGNPCV
jgi:hypothetical protein